MPLDNISVRTEPVANECKRKRIKNQIETNMRHKNVTQKTKMRLLSFIILFAVAAATATSVGLTAHEPKRKLYGSETRLLYLVYEFVPPLPVFGHNIVSN